MVILSTNDQICSFFFKKVFRKKIMQDGVGVRLPLSLLCDHSHAPLWEVSTSVNCLVIAPAWQEPGTESELAQETLPQDIREASGPPRKPLGGPKKRWQTWRQPAPGFDTVFEPIILAWLLCEACL